MQTGFTERSVMLQHFILRCDSDKSDCRILLVITFFVSIIERTQRLHKLSRAVAFRQHQQQDIKKRQQKGNPVSALLLIQLHFSPAARTVMTI